LAISGADNAELRDHPDELGIIQRYRKYPSFRKEQAVETAGASSHLVTPG